MRKNRTKRITHLLGWRFTETEEEYMRRAVEEAKKFMASYGKGKKPEMIDLSHYEQQPCNQND